MVGVLWFLHHAMEIPDLVGNILSLLKQSCSLHAMSFIFAGIWVSSSLLLMWMNCHTSSQDVPIFLYVSVKAVRFLGSWCLLVQYLYTINRHLRLEQVCTAPHGLGPLTQFFKAKWYWLKLQAVWCSSTSSVCSKCCTFLLFWNKTSFSLLCLHSIINFSADPSNQSFHPSHSQTPPGLWSCLAAVPNICHFRLNDTFPLVPDIGSIRLSFQSSASGTSSGYPSSISPVIGEQHMLCFSYMIICFCHHVWTIIKKKIRPKLLIFWPLEGPSYVRTTWLF